MPASKNHKKSSTKGIGEILKNELMAPLRQKLFGAIKPKLAQGEKLEVMEMRTLYWVIDYISQGYDIRTQLGVDKKKGAPSWAQPFHKFVALNYWAHCTMKDKLYSEKQVASLVGAAWGISMASVRKIAKDYKTLSKTELDEARLDKDKMEVLNLLVAQMNKWFKELKVTV